MQTLRHASAVCLLSCLALPCYGELQEIVVEGRRVANDQPATSYSSVITALRYDPRTEIQPRGIPEGQADISVHGGLFESTGVQLGVLTLLAPQTGHYTAEVPVDPALLTSPVVHVGIDNALLGVNATVATVGFDFMPIAPGGAVSIGAGTDNLQRYSVNASAALTETWRVAGAWARSEGDGTVPNGDHEFERLNLLLQRAGEDSRSNLLVAGQNKFYGWPGAYTGFANLAETDDTSSLLVYADHEADLHNGQLRVGAFYRTLEDDYDFDRTTRETGGPGSFEHKTQVYGMGFALTQEASAGLSWQYRGQVLRDHLVRSTDLNGGDFDRRDSANLTIAPALRTPVGTGELELTGALRWDWSNRDGDVVLPSVGIRWRPMGDHSTHTFSLDYTHTSQLPGYTALKSGSTGLFGGNPELGRERSKQLSLGWQQEAADWHAQAIVFRRQDDDLVDWTFNSASPFARQANPVDLEVDGIELTYGRSWTHTDLLISYTHLTKDADYLANNVDASFYALNFAKDRLTLALTWQIASGLELRLDNEYRQLQDNPRRTGDDAYYHGALGLIWQPDMLQGLRFNLIVDNIADSDVEVFLGTPPSGRQTSFAVDYRW